MSAKTVEPTSVMAYHAILPHLSKSRAEMYQGLFELGRATSREVVKHLGKDLGWQRMSELEIRGVVRQDGHKQCGISGMWSKAYVITDATTVTEPPTRTAKTTELRALLERALAHMERHGDLEAKMIAADIRGEL